MMNLFKNTRKHDRIELFEKLPVHRAVWLQVVPALVSQLVALLYNLADTYFVGMLNAPAQLAAVTIVMPPFLMLTAISNLFSIGAASAIGHALGKHTQENVPRIASAAFWSTLAVAVALCLTFPLYDEPVLQLAGATADTMSFSRQYAFWTIVVGGPATMLNLLFINLVRAEGRAATASLGTSLGGLLNVILDPLFILPGCLNLGVAGAGLATALSNIFSMLFFFAYLVIRRRDTLLSIAPKHLRHFREHILNIIAIGCPAALQYCLIVMSCTAQAYFISRYSTAAIAALGIAKKMDTLPLYFALGVAQGILPLLAYNHGAGDILRRRSIFKYGTCIAVGFASICLVVYEIFAPQLVRLFIADKATADYSAAFLRFLVVAMPMMAACNQMIVQFQAMAKVKQALLASIIRKGGLDIPLLFVMDRAFKLYGCICVQPLVDIIALAVVSLCYARMLKQEKDAPDSAHGRSERRQEKVMGHS